MKSKVTRRSVLRSLALGAAGGIAFDVYSERYVDWIQVERHDLTLPRWDADGFRVAVLADLHVMTAKRRERAIAACRIAVAEKPDVIVVVGDFLERTEQRFLDDLVKAVEPLREASCPCVGVLGNHDYWSENPQLIARTLDSTSLHLMANESFEVQGVTIAGIDDAIVGRHRLDFFPPGGASRSLLALLHEPDFADDMPRHVSLQLSGHSHGGQICWPGGIPIHPPPFGRKYTAGFYDSTPAPLYVTRGVGTTGPDYRTFCRPEVSLLTLKSV